MTAGKSVKSKKILPRQGEFQIADKKSYSPPKGRIALSANERIAEFPGFAIQTKFADVNKLGSM